MDAATVSFDFIAAFRRARSAAQLLTQLERAGSAFDFDHVCMSGVSSTVPPWAPPGFVHRWPAGWYRRYLDRGYLRRDPIARAVLTTTRPFAWDEIEVPPEDVAAAEFMADAASFGLAAGFCVPIYQVGRVTAVSFGGKRRAGLTEDDRGALQLIALFAHARACELQRGDAYPEMSTPQLRLTRRETEILQWSSEGMNTREIARILAISQETVEKHVHNICERLGTTNRTHAVATALRNRLIS